MNPAVLGALIGAVPGTLAPGLATWASIQSGRTNLEQTKLTLADDYSRWVREKRADSYVEMLRFLRAAELKRAEICDMPATAADVENIRKAVQAYKDTSLSSQAVDVFAKADPYVSKEADDDFRAAWDASRNFWQLARKQAESGKLDRDELDEEDNRATDADMKFREMARRDLRTSGDLSLPPSATPRRRSAPAGRETGPGHAEGAPPYPRMPPYGQRRP
jgi:hypothetical protein